MCVCVCVCVCSETYRSSGVLTMLLLCCRLWTCDIGYDSFGVKNEFNEIPKINF